MKIKILVLSMFVLLAACAFVVEDTRTPEEVSAAQTAKAEQTAEANLLPTVTPTPEPPPLPTVEPQVEPEALIKGNISRSGEKIYHVPGQANYDNVIIDPDHGERYFTTEEEAVEAGWRKSLR